MEIESVIRAGIYLILGFVVGREIRNLFDAFANARLTSLRIYKCLAVSNNRIEKEKVNMERAKNDFEYYLEEIKKYEGDKKNEMVDLTTDSVKRLKKSENIIFELQKRSIRIYDFLRSNFILYMMHQSNLKKVLEKRDETDNG